MAWIQYYLTDSVLSAINLGIYTVDMVYLLTYEKDEKFDKQLERARALASNIGAGQPGCIRTLMLVVFQQERALDDLIILLDHIRGEEEGERFMAMMNDLKHIYMELADSDELAGINTQNITENQVFKDLVEQLSIIRNRIIVYE